MMKVGETLEMDRVTRKNAFQKKEQTQPHEFMMSYAWLKNCTKVNKLSTVAVVICMESNVDPEWQCPFLAMNHLRSHWSQVL